jgi:hypothetical protein
MPSLSRKCRIQFYHRGSDPLSQNEPAGVATVAAWPPSKILSLASADRRRANDRCGRIVTLLESYLRRLEGLRKRYYGGALRISSFDSAYSARGRASTGAKWSRPMTTWTTMRTACGAICLAASLSMRETAKASPARLPCCCRYAAKFARASDLRILLLAFLGRQNALHMFHLAMFSEAISSMDAEVA